MKREDARALARTLMDAAGLTGWRFRFDNARRRAGACTHGARTISLSGRSPTCMTRTQSGG